MDSVGTLGQFSKSKRRVVGFLIALFVPFLLYLSTFQPTLLTSFSRDLLGLAGIIFAVYFGGVIAGGISSMALLLTVQLGYMGSEGTGLPLAQLVLDALLLMGEIYLANRVFSRHKSFKKMAHVDELTGLPNRRAIMPALERACAMNLGTDRKSVLMFVDLDFFKAVNDTFGHQAGDYVLVHFGRRLREIVRPEDTVARIGGDEFMVLMPQATEQTHIEALAKRILEKVTKEYVFGTNNIVIGASIGIAICPDDADASEKLIEIADRRLYISKMSGKNMAYDGKKKILLKA